MIIPLVLYSVLIAWSLHFTENWFGHFLILGFMVAVYVISVNTHRHEDRVARIWIYTPYFLPLALQSSFPDGTLQEKLIAVLWTLIYLAVVIYVFRRVGAGYDDLDEGGLSQKQQVLDAECGPSSACAKGNGKQELQLKFWAGLLGLMGFTGCVLMSSLQSFLVGAGLVFAFQVYVSRYRQRAMFNFFCVIAVFVFLIGFDLRDYSRDQKMIWIAWIIATILVALMMQLQQRKLFQVKGKLCEVTHD